MRGIVSLLAIVMALIIPVGALAQVVDEYVKEEADGDKILYRSVYMLDPSTGEKTLVDQKFRVNEDGTLTPMESASSDKLREIHEHTCRELGGKPASSGNVWMSRGTVSGGACELPVSPDADREEKSADTQGDMSDSGAEMDSGVVMASGSGYVSDISVPSITYGSAGTNILVTGQYTYRYYNQPTYSDSMTVDDCSIGHSGLLGSPNSDGWGDKTVYLRCYILPPTTPQSYVTTLNACVAGNCLNDTGVLIVE